MMTSVVMAALNEGPDLEATVAMCRASVPMPHEIIVVDDSSVRPLAPRLASLHCDVVRNETPMGSGGAKDRGVRMSSGDLVVVIDAHVRPAWDWLATVRKNHAEHPDAVFCYRSRGFESSSTFDGRGCVIRWRPHGYVECAWSDPTARDMDRVPGLMGGCYSFRRGTIDHVGGYAPLLVGYGHEEEFLSLRLWACGKEVRFSMMAVPHHYRGTGEPEPDRRTAMGRPPAWAMWYNRHVCLSVCFPDLYERKLKQKLLRCCNDVGLISALHDRRDSIESLRSMIDNRRTVSAAEVERRMRGLFP